MILVTGGAGKTGRAVLRALKQAGLDVRALVRRVEQREMVLLDGAQEAIVGDLRDPTILHRAVDGVQALFHIPPNVHPDEVAIGEAMIAAARSAGVGRVVYHSVLHPAIEAMPHHWEKMRVEELLITSGLDYTILQPAAYMQNLFAQWDSIVKQGCFKVPYPVETRLCLVDLEDLAEAARIVLTDSDHTGATYQIVGTEALSQAEVAEVLSEVLRCPVEAVSIPLQVWEAQAREAGLGEHGIRTLLKMFEYYQRHGLAGNPRILNWLLGRPPRTLAGAARREALRRSEEEL